MADCPTPHINCRPGDFAKTVLMPGDPKRSEFIAKNFLDSPRLVNDVRGVKGFTGSYKGVPVSVMASGMGMPSIGIYSYELFRFFGVENIIRVGSAGALRPEVGIRDIVLGQGACTDSSYMAQFGIKGTFAPIADFGLLTAAVEEARKIGARWHVGDLLSTDAFYNADPTVNETWAKLGVLAVEMEAAALYVNAHAAGCRALAICTVSDSLVTGESTSAEERERSFTEMMTVALETAVSASRF